MCLTRPFAMGLGAGLALLLAVPSPARSTDGYPNRPIRLIVPTAAGSSPDILARLLQPYLERSLKQPVVVDNRAGASQMIGTEAVAKAAPDGHTLVVVNTTFTVTGALNSTIPFDPEKDFEPISLLVSNPMVFAINAKLPARTLAEFIALAKAQPEKFNYGTSGASTQAHLLIEMWSARAGIKMQHIPYRGGAPAALSVGTGETQLVLMSPLAVWGQIEAGTVRALATGGLTRDSNLPDLPTAAESGFPGFEGVQWFGLLTTGGTPKPIVQKLNAEINKALREPELVEKLRAQGMTATGGTPEQFRDLIVREMADWKETARRADIKPVR
jgi:tripartite-type tricarboxylate transporter receptor subunit TctC